MATFMIPLLITLGPAAARAQAPAAQETNIADVTAELLPIVQHDKVMLIAVRLRNTGTAPKTSPDAIDFENFVVLDPVNRKKMFPLKSESGHYLAGPISDWNDGGRWYVRLLTGASRIVWALFEPVAPGTRINIEIPLLQPFDDVEVPAPAPATGSAAADGPLTATVTGATRANEQLRLRVRLARDRGSLQDEAIEYEDVSLLDPATVRQYAVLRDQDGLYLAQPVSDSNDGGRYFVNGVPRDGRVLMNLTFTPPPDSVRRVLLLLPHFPPIGPFDIEGSTGAAEAGGVAAGRTIGVEGALKDLGAKVTDREIRIDLAADVLFDFDKAVIRKEAEPSLQKVATVLQAHPGAKVSIEGHTDAKGSDAYNQTLSEQRATAVKGWLVANAGASDADLTTRGWGKTKPVAHNTRPDGSDDPEGRAKNRRVEIVVAKGAP